MIGKEEAISERYRFTPVIMLTTESLDHRKEEGRQAEVTGWIVKPFKPDQLAAVLRRVGV